MTVAAVILAAGASTRFGSPKQLARIGGRTLIERVVRTASEAGLAPLIVVVPPGVAVPPEAVPEINDNPSAGISRSVRLGLAAVPPEASSAMILLADEPMLQAEVISAVLAATVGEPRRIVAGRAAGRIGPPVFLPREHFELALAAHGDQGLGRLLAGHPAITLVDLPSEPIDVDTVADLERLGERCPGCRELYAPSDATDTHEYIGASPACWQAFTQLLAREFESPAFGVVHRHTVDIYAVQHPGDDGRRQRQSVAVHLVGLCHWLEHGLTAQQLNPMTQTFASSKRDWPWLTPPERYDLTVTDVLRATSGDEHVRLVRAWGASVWEAWAPHHATVRGWAAEALQDRR